MSKQRGRWRYHAKFEQHNGNRDATGNPTYDVSADWSTVIEDWPCRVDGKGGGEQALGRQMTAQSTHLLTGDMWALASIKEDMRVRVSNGIQASVVHVDDDGIQQEGYVEIKRET